MTRANGEGKPVVALDIDGTLGDYHGNFINFATKYLDTDFGFLIGEKNPGLPLWKWMGIEHHVYREAKLAYRQGGWKRWMPCYDGAAELTWAIQDAGAEVWICTTRPYLRLDNVDPDTREWLRRNKIRYDAVIFDPLHGDVSKYGELGRQAGNRVCSVVDDLPEMVREAQRQFALTIPIVRDQPYNKHLDWPRRASTMDGLWRLVISDINTWKGSGFNG